MFDTNPGGGNLSECGRQSFCSFDKAIVLRTVERVRGNDEVQLQFRNTLKNIRNGSITNADYSFLMKRLCSKISQTENDTFNDAPYLVSNHSDEKNLNYEALRAMGHPICRIDGVHKPAAASKTSARDAMGLEPTIVLAEGAKVMLRSNLWVSAGLTNGSLGIVHGFLYDPEKPGPPHLPSAVCVKFPAYTGEAWDPSTMNTHEIYS